MKKTIVALISPFGAALSAILFSLVASSFAQTATPPPTSGSPAGGPGPANPPTTTAPANSAAPASPGGAGTGTAGSQTNASDSVIELSPFQVDTSRETGYFAENTLAGSRLNTNIGDLAASITVVTRQQMIDTGSTDLNDVFLYEANTEGTGNYTAFNVDTRGAVQDFSAGFQGGAPSLPFTANTANRIRGISAADRARDFYPSIQRLPFDLYNTESVEISRGPNSILFGLGSPSGIVNQSASKANLRRASQQLEFRTGSWESYRASFSVNRPLIEDKLAIFAAGLFDEKGFRREPSYDITRRGYVAATYKPFRYTTIRANFEDYENRNRRPNSITPRDFITPWIQNGRPSYNPITRQLTVNGSVVTDPATGQPRIFSGTQTDIGVAGNVQTANNAIQYFGSGRPVLYVDQGREQLYLLQQIPSAPNVAGVPAQFAYVTPNPIPAPPALSPAVRMTRSQGPNTLRNQIPGLPAGLLFSEPGVTDKSIYDWESINIVSGNFGRETARVYNVELEQQITPQLFLQLGWYREDYKQRVDYYISQQTGVTLYVDTNTVNLDGTANPFYGRPFIEVTQPDAFEQPEDNENARATLAYDLDLSKRSNGIRWFGRHRVMGLAQEQWVRRSQLRYRPYIAGNNQIWNPVSLAGNPLAPDVWAGNTTQNAIERRFYVGDTTPRVTQDPGLYPNETRQNTLRWYNPVNGQWVNESVTIDNALHFVSSQARQNISSQALAVQSYLFNERLATTFGWRRDESEAKNSLGLTRNSAGLTDPTNLNVWGPPQNVKGNTKTYGGVLKPFLHWRALDARADAGNFFAEVVRSLHFSYNRSDNFTPAPLQTDFYGTPLALPTGQGKDYGVGISLFGNKLYARVNWFEVSHENARSTRVVQQPLTRTATVDDTYFRAWAAMVTGQPQNSAAVANILQLPGTFGTTPNQLFNQPMAATETVNSKGLEAQITYNPTRNWNMKFTAGKQEAIFSRIAPEFDAWVSQRMPIWLNATAAGFPSFWNTTGADFTAASATNPNVGNPGLGASTRVQDYYFTNVDAIVRTNKRLEGKVTPDQRKWRWNLISNYNFSEGPLSGLGLGGAGRWESRAAIGYLGAAPDPDTIIRTLDVNRPVYSDANFHLDLWASYTLKSLPWVGDKVRAKFQLNVRDVLENGGLEPIAINPDGQPIAFRIRDPRQWLLTATFDF